MLLMDPLLEARIIPSVADVSQVLLETDPSPFFPQTQEPVIDCDIFPGTLNRILSDVFAQHIFCSGIRSVYV